MLSEQESASGNFAGWVNGELTIRALACRDDSQTAAHAAAVHDGSLRTLPLADDELNEPLGKTARKTRRLRLPAALPRIAAALLAVCLSVFAGWAMLVTDPYGGEPMAVVATVAPVVAEAPKAGGATPGNRAYDGPASQQAATPAQSPSQVVTIIDGSTGQRQQVPIASAPDVRAPVDQKLLETTRHGAIPKIGPDGARPSEVYAQRLARNARRDAPRIAIVVSGLGIGASATENAFARLPGPITFAFTPYASDAERLATRARATGHETLLQVPMEPVDYPDNDPGPQTLLTALAPQQNVDRLHWMMSRFQGYVGIANQMGARFTPSEPAMTPVMREVAKRGLIYFDDGANPRSIASQIAGANNLPFAKADVTLDAVPNPAGIDRALARLEQIARERGSAVGISSPLPAAVDRIAQWIKAAEQRGIVIVPISAIAVRASSS
jgi:uncharacterized protein